ncbi:MAG: glycosyltransferase family 2 protein [Lachnospiraceae bacterium]|nr:glycosyltransferase family 2 protein [Lachnospiraceae bacterium]
MKNDPRISVIIPVYHSEKTLGTCLGSVLSQDYKNVELLVVLNGMDRSDQSALRCLDVIRDCAAAGKVSALYENGLEDLAGQDGNSQEELAGQDSGRQDIGCENSSPENDEQTAVETESGLSDVHPLIRVFWRNEKGVSAARNYGIRKAKGELLLFLDSDDVMGEHAISRMQKRISSDDSDMVIAGFSRCTSRGRVSRFPHMDGVIETVKDREQIEKLYIDDLLNMPWNKLYKKELIRAEFPTDLSLGEDLCFNLDYMLQTKRISVLCDSVYDYTVDESATSLSYQKRSDRVYVCMRLYRKANAFFRALAERTENPDGTSTIGQNPSGINSENRSGISSGPKRFWVTDTKVVATFLDELCLLGEAGYGAGKRADKDDDKRKWNHQVRGYVRAIRKFVKGGRRDIRLFLPDHKIIYVPASRGFVFPVKVLILLRAFVAGIRKR